MGAECANRVDWGEGERGKRTILLAARAGPPCFGLEHDAVVLPKEWDSAVLTSFPTQPLVTVVLYGLNGTNPWTGCPITFAC